MPSTPSTDDESTASQTVATVPVLSEALSIERRVVDAGGVRLRKQVREEPVKLQEPLKRGRRRMLRPLARSANGRARLRGAAGEPRVPVLKIRAWPTRGLPTTGAGTRCRPIGRPPA